MSFYLLRKVCVLTRGPSLDRLDTPHSPSTLSPVLTWQWGTRWPTRSPRTRGRRSMRCTPRNPLLVTWTKGSLLTPLCSTLHHPPRSPFSSLGSLSSGQGHPGTGPWTDNTQSQRIDGSFLSTTKGGGEFTNPPTLLFSLRYLKLVTLHDIYLYFIISKVLGCSKSWSIKWSLRSSFSGTVFL